MSSKNTGIITPNKLKYLGFCHNKDRDTTGVRYVIDEDKTDEKTQLMLQRFKKYIDDECIAEGMSEEDSYYWSGIRTCYELKLDDDFILTFKFDGPIYEDEDVNLFGYSHIDFNTSKISNHDWTLAEVYNPSSIEIVNAMIDLYNAGSKDKKKRRI